MKFKGFVGICLVIAVLLGAWALADTYVAASRLKPSAEVYCLDNAHVLTDATRGEIVFSNDLLSAKCGAQIVVVTLDTTGSESIGDYATELFNTWGVGDAKAANGFLLLLAIEDDDYYAVCGDGLQPKFTSGSLKDYFDKYLETDFAAGRYDAGVKKFFEAVFTRVADTYNADVTVSDGIAAYEASETGVLADAQFGGGGIRYSEAGSVGDSFNMIVGVLFVIVLVLLLVRLTRRRRVNRGVFVSAPPPPPVGQGGYRGVNSMPGAGGYRGPAPTPRRTSSDADWFMRGMLHGMLRSSGSGFFGSSGSSRSSRSSGGSFRSSGGSFRSSGGSRSSGSSRSFGGGHSSGGGAGRGRH